ncbi:MAG: hypothetical protein HOQ28_14570 [Thermoleophilia bacterium]|nr:hypothetical protein [Thermoleophilia bacterium]
MVHAARAGALAPARAAELERRMRDLLGATVAGAGGFPRRRVRVHPIEPAAL